jgi:hypothetical protein
MISSRPGFISQKNQPLQSQAAGDLGLGDVLNQQVQDMLEERRKKLLAGGAAQQPNAQGLNGTTNSMAAMALLGQGMGAVGSMSLGKSV